MSLNLSLAEPKAIQLAARATLTLTILAASEPIWAVSKETQVFLFSIRLIGLLGMCL